MVAGFIVLGGIGAVSYMQGRFDQSDIRNAVAAVKLNRKITGECQGRILSRWKGIVEVTCSETGNDATYRVNVVAGVIEREP